jgi:formamidopyrimidine-DNA glycosylase
MPELPEVEVTRRALAPGLTGRVIARVSVRAAPPLFLSPPARLRRRLPGRRVETLQRRGKYLLLGLDDGATLLVHLGMTGQLLLGGAPAHPFLRRTGAGTVSAREAVTFEPDRHTHLVLVFADGPPDLCYRDVRRFGRIALLGPGETSPRLERLGPDALGLDGPTLRARLRGRRAPIKALLLDQHVVAGVGNIYADEALFRARIRPLTPAGRLSAARCARLAEALTGVLERAIETGGSSIRDYRHPDGGAGAYQDERLVYGREGEPCRACGRPIRRIVLAGRACHHCPRCQR